MKRITLYILVIIVALAPLANAFEIRFENTTDKTLIYRVYWLACDWEGSSKVTEQLMMLSELEAGERLSKINDYGPGPYAVTWKSLISSNDYFYRGYKFTVEDDKHIILSMPDMMPVRLATLKEKYNAINR